MKKIKTGILNIYLIVLAGVFNTAFAQDAPKYNINFKDCSFEEAIKMAQKEGKKIFVDCYTVW
jgi:2-phospho-L-lactate guanylyltransferase (CobY/MobA/RfbA family)